MKYLLHIHVEMTRHQCVSNNISKCLAEYGGMICKCLEKHSNMLLTLYHKSFVYFKEFRKYCAKYRPDVVYWF